MAIQQTKLNPEKVREMRRLRAEGYTYPALSRLFVVSENTVARTCRGNAWMKVTQGVEVLTDAAAELRNLENPLLQSHAQQPVAIGPSPALIKLQEEINAHDTQEENANSIPEQYRGVDPTADPEAYRRILQQMIEEAQKRTAHNGSPPPSVPVRQHPVDIETVDRHTVGAINAQELLETLKDEHT